MPVRIQDWKGNIEGQMGIPVRCSGEVPGLAQDLNADMANPDRSRTAYCSAMEGGRSIAALENCWRSLYEQCDQPSPFAAWEWVESWWNNFSIANPQAPLSLFPIAVYGPDNTLIGIAPFYFAASESGALKRRALRLLGDLGPAPGLSEELPVLLRRGSEAIALQALLEYLTGAARQHWDTLHLCVPVSPGITGDTDAETLVKGMKAFSSSVALNSEWLTLPTSWDQLRASLSKSTRDNLAYYPRLLDRHEHVWAIKRLTDPDEMAAASDLLVDLHRRRAQCTVCVPHLDHLPSSVHEASLREALKKLAKLGRASIWVMEINGEIAAAQAVLEDSVDVCIYYSGFEPNYRSYSPLTILHAEIIKTAIIEGKNGVNFLGGAFYYKSRWGARSIPRFVMIRKLRSSPISIIRTALHYAARK